MEETVNALTPYLEIIKVILPAIITGIISFLATRYKYNRNIPLDNLEIAYNRVYYPVYRIIQEQNKKDNCDVNILINSVSTYFNKYEKYVDSLTLQTFRILCKHENDGQKDYLYQKFKNNIYDNCIFLRKRLGYLESGFIEIFKYAPKGICMVLRIAIYLIIMEVCMMTVYLTKDNHQKICEISVVVFLILFVVIILEIIIGLIRTLFYRIKTCIKIKQRNN